MRPQVCAASTRKGQVRIYFSSDIPELGPTRPVTAVCQIIVSETGSAESRQRTVGEFFSGDARTGRGGLWPATDTFFRSVFFVRNFIYESTPLRRRREIIIIKCTILKYNIKRVSGSGWKSPGNRHRRRPVFIPRIPEKNAFKHHIILYRFRIRSARRAHTSFDAVRYIHIINNNIIM